MVPFSWSSSIEWSLFASTFGLIFLAELPDKTAFATLLLSTAHNPLAVFLGAAAAFVIQSLVAVACGSLFALLPPAPVHIASALLFFVFAFLMWRRDGEEEAPGGAGENGRFFKSVSAAFLVIFVAEWGDLTQLATATLTAKWRAPFTIFLAATAALWVVTALGVIIGHRAKRVLNPSHLQKLAAVALAGGGCYLLVGALRHLP